MTDATIINNILQGDKNLYAIIIRRYNKRLYRIAMSIVNDDNEVEDIMQVTYINAYENLEKFAFRSSFPTWLTRILINECLLRLKKRGRTIIAIDDNIEKTMQEQQPPEAQGPVAKLINAELKTVLDHAISQLPEIYRTVFVMREIENMSVAETTACLAISEVNVKVRLNRAKAMLRNSLASYYKKEDILHFHLSRCDKMVDTVMKKINS
jgi:RNA polymerase sigma factor (sigma-70 family)